MSCSAKFHLKWTKADGTCFTSGQIREKLGFEHALKCCTSELDNFVDLRFTRVLEFMRIFSELLVEQKYELLHNSHQKGIFF